MIPEFLVTDLLTVDAGEGIISLNKNRMLLLDAEALFQMREELVQTLGEDIARSVIIRFGYRFGIKDATALSNYNFKNDADWILAGPKMHALEGIVHATCDALEYDRSQGTFYMSGIWRNSYEVENHLKKYGRASEPICWLTTGYASGFATGFMGRQAVCTETMCQGMGDPYCRFEIRSIEACNGGEAYQVINDLKQNTILRSMQTLLEEERERASLLQDLNKAIIDIGMSLESNSMPVKTVKYAQKLFNAEKAILTIVNGKTKKTTLYETMNQREVATNIFYENNRIVEFMLDSRKPVIWNNSDKVIDTGSGSIKLRNFISIPLYSENELFGVIIVINKMSGKQFTQSDQELLALLAGQSAIALGNARIYEQTNQKLHEKVTELHGANNLLSNEHDTLQKATNIHSQFTSLVLEGHGLEMIAHKLGIIVNRPVIIVDQFFHIMSVYQGTTKMDLKEFWQNAIQDTLLRDRLLLLEDKQFNVNDRHIDICCNFGNLKLFVVPVMAGKDKLGFVITLEEDQPLSQLECVAMEQAATIIALELLKQKAAFETELRIRKDFLDDLLERIHENKENTMIRAKQLGLDLSGLYEVIAFEFTTIRAKQLGLDLSRLYRVIVIEFTGEEPDGLHTGGSYYQALERVIKYVSVNIALVGEKNNIIGILSSSVGSKEDDDRELHEVIEKLEKKFSSAYPDCRWYIGIGSQCTGVANFSSSYQDACTTIEIIKSLKFINKCKAYEQLGVFGLLNINIERFKRFIHQTIGPLLEYDQKNNSQLISTLNLYNKNNCNLQKAARSGFMSSSTMRYRLRRVTEIANIDLTNTETNLIIELALKTIEDL